MAPPSTTARLTHTGLCTLLALSLTACPDISASPPDCFPDETCPTGERCVAGQCQPEGQFDAQAGDSGGGMGGAAGQDAGQMDAMDMGQADVGQADVGLADAEGVDAGEPDMGLPEADAGPVVSRAGPFASLAASNQEVCGLSAQGEVVCWRPDRGEDEALPIRLRALVGGGEDRFCGLDLEQRERVWCWQGDEQPEDSDIEEAPLEALAVSNRHTCGLTEGGDVLCTGSPSWNLPEDRRYRALSSSDSFVCGVIRNGRARCDGTGSVPEPPNEDQFDQISVNARGGCGLLQESGQVSCWSRSGEGAPEEPLEALDAQDQVTCGITRRGPVVCWGDLPGVEVQRTILEASPGTWRAVATGEDFTCVLDPEGRPRCVEL